MQPHPSVTAIAADGTTVLLLSVITFVAVSVCVFIVVRERRKRAEQEDNA